MKTSNLGKSVLQGGLAFALLLGGSTIFATPTRAQEGGQEAQTQQRNGRYYSDRYYDRWYEQQTYDYCYKERFQDRYGNYYYVCYRNKPYYNTPRPSNPSIYRR